MGLTPTARSILPQGIATPRLATPFMWFVKAGEVSSPHAAYFVQLMDNALLAQLVEQTIRTRHTGVQVVEGAPCYALPCGRKPDWYSGKDRSSRSRSSIKIKDFS